MTTAALAQRDGDEETMKNLGTILAAIFLTGVLVMYMCTFQVRFTEVALLKTWGKPAEAAITEAGLRWKWPPPVQTAVIYDQRARILEDRTLETRTIDGKNVLVTTFTLWKIIDPVKFHTNFPDGVEEGENTLRTMIVAHKQAVIGKRSLSEFVSVRESDRHLREIEDEIRLAAVDSAKDEFGIEIIDFGIKKLGLPESVTSAIFQSMKSNEEKKAAGYRASGEARAADIEAEARAAESRILSAARQKADEIRSEAERVVSGYYEEFAQNPELRIYLDKLRALAESLQDNTTLIIDTTQAPFDVLDPENRKAVAETGSAN